MAVRVELDDEERDKTFKECGRIQSGLRKVLIDHSTHF